MRWLRDAFCEPSAPRPPVGASTPTWSWRRPPPRCPPGSNGLAGDLLERHGRQALGPGAAVVRGLRRGRPAATDRRACIRAVEEQAAFAARGHLAIIARADRATRSTRSSSRAARPRARLWPQIVADVLGVTVHVPEVKESTALGAALFAGIGVGLYRDLGEVAGVARPRRADVRARRRGRADVRRALRGAGARSIRASSSCPRTGLLRPMWWPAGADPTTRRAQRSRPMPEADSSERKQFHADIPQRNARSSSRARAPTTGACRTGSRGSSGPRAAGR